MIVKLEPQHVAADACHVWSLDTDAGALDIGAAAALLSAEERQRADRFHLAHDSRAFTLRRAVLRELLASYSQQDPAALRFTYTEHGKPRLVDGAGLEFNMSDCDGLAIYAITRGRPVGIDVERLDRPVDIDSIARRFFAAAEVEALASVAPGDRAAAFLRCWTLKEAFLKAVGSGLLRPLDSFAVSIAADEPPRLTWVADDPSELGRWSLASFEPAPGCISALAVAGDPRIRHVRSLSGQAGG